MLWETIKNILQKQPGTCIIIEDGKPAFVVSSFEEYEKLLSENTPGFQKPTLGSSEQELLERINQEITSWKAGQAENLAAEDIGETSGDEIKIEDLPL